MRFSPSSSHLPSPAAMTFPFCGFSLAVSGRTIPLAVVSSSSIGLTISRSPRGFSFIREPPLFGRYYWKGSKSRSEARLCRTSRRLALSVKECQEKKESDSGRSAAGQQTAAEQLRDPLAPASHHPVVVPLECRAGDRGQQIHPGPGRRHVPLVEDGRRAFLLVQPPTTEAGQLADGVRLEQVGPLDPRRRHLELHPIGQQALPDQPRDGADPVAAFL